MNESIIKTMEHTSRYSRQLLILLLLAISWIILVFFTNKMPNLRVATTYVIPFLLYYGLFLATMMFHHGAGRPPPLLAIGGVLIIVGGTAFDVLITIIKSPTLTREANPIARTLLDSGHSVTFVYVYAGLCQTLDALINCLLWLGLLKHRRTIITSAWLSEPKSLPQFFKAALGGGHLTWRQFFLPFRWRQRPSSYHLIWLAAAIISADSLHRYMCALAWLGWKPISINLASVLAMSLGFCMFLLWLWRLYRCKSKTDFLNG